MDFYGTLDSYVRGWKPYIGDSDPHQGCKYLLKLQIGVIFISIAMRWTLTLLQPVNLRSFFGLTRPQSRSNLV